MDLEDLIKKIGIKPKEKNEALDTYIEDSNKKREKLEILLSEFLRITSDKSTSILWGLLTRENLEGYYNYLDKNINYFDFDLPDVISLTNNAQLYKIIRSDYTENSKFGLFLSVFINKKIKKNEKVQIITSMPIHCLFYKMKDTEAHVNIAGDYLGYLAERSKIHADEVRDDAGKDMESCDLHVKKSRSRLGYYAKNSKIYAEEAGDYAGDGIDSCELHVKKAGNWLGYKSKNSEIYVKEAGHWLGQGAKNSKIYADKAGYGAGYDMKNSELFIYKLDEYLADSCFRGNNEVYLGKESYKKFIQNYPKYINKVKLWEKKN